MRAEEIGFLNDADDVIGRVKFEGIVSNFLNEMTLIVKLEILMHDEVM